MAVFAEVTRRFIPGPWLIRAFVMGFLYQPILIGAAFFFPEVRSFTTENIHLQTTAIKIITLFAGLLPGVLYVTVYLFSVFHTRSNPDEQTKLWSIPLSLAAQFLAMVLGVLAFLPVLWLMVAIPPLSACLEYIFRGL